MRPRLAALIPARNEEGRIGALLSRLHASLPEAELFVVDGQSQDGTVAEALAAGATVIQQEGRGYAGALATGYRALAGRVDRLIQLDADGQHPAEVSRALLDSLDEADWVIGSRHGTSSGGSLDRRLGNRLLSELVRLSTGSGLHDVTSGYWALGPAALSAFSSRFPARVADANARVYGRRIGLRILEVPVIVEPRLSGRSMHDGVTGWRNLAASVAAVLEERLRRVP